MAVSFLIKIGNHPSPSIENYLNKVWYTPTIAQEFYVEVGKN